MRSLCFEPDWARITGQTAGARWRGQTEPVAESVDLAGPVSLELALTATGPSTDLFAKLLDVHPDGEASSQGVQPCFDEGRLPSPASRRRLRGAGLLRGTAARRTGARDVSRPGTAGRCGVSPVPCPATPGPRGSRGR
ncbi:CocE/NonD family hydrolase C-terminal non-catalytic domain-containing protein [Streptomyces sp. RLB1-33]|nr:CocE/NonD family hydrolase C-terminal non-catalytic domain-containing protein [Streptomyces sp. RLB1-33]